MINLSKYSTHDLRELVERMERLEVMRRETQRMWDALFLLRHKLKRELQRREEARHGKEDGQTG